MPHNKLAPRTSAFLLFESSKGLRLRKHEQLKFKQKEIAAMVAFSLLLALSIVLGNHIVISGNPYSGLVTENFIAPYSPSDFGIFIAAFAIAIACCLLLNFLFCKGINSTLKRGDDKPLKARPIAIYAIVMFALQLPYLLTYYPGLIFNDSISSISQALGLLPYYNHHPVVYTLLIQACIDTAHALGFSTNTGCALYSIVQMVVMCTMYSTMIQWIIQRTGVRGWCRVALVILFGLTPYIATYSIAMWKDSLFSAAIVLATVLLFDFVKSGGSIARKSKSWIPLFALSCFIIAFLRSNGVLVDLGILLALTAISLFKRGKRSGHTTDWVATAIPACALAANLIITGPLYTALGIAPSSKVEGYGIPLNQMARVAALDGDMSESDKEYMNELLPLSEYEAVYSPTCTDPLKWDEHFNSEPLETDFFSHWASMLIKNPVVYFESWELQTFGYWTLNHPAVLLHSSNISGGVPRTAADPMDAESLGIFPQNLLGENAEALFPLDTPSVPLGWVAWGVAFLALVCILQGRARYLIPLIPCLMLIASLLVASPIWYWERYGAAMQFLIPFFISMPFAMAKHEA